MRSEGSGAVIEDDTEDNHLTTKMAAEKKGPGKKHSSRKKDEVKDLENRMFAKFVKRTCSSHLV